MLKKTLHTILIILGFLHLLHSQGLQTFDELLSQKFAKSDSLNIKILDAEKDYLLKDKGLRINSSVGTNEFGDLESGNIFRIKAGLEWNILDEGFMDRKITSKLLDVEKDIELLQIKEDAFNDNYAYLYNHIIYSFNEEKLKYLEEKSYLLNILSKRYEALYHSHAAEYQDLLSIYDKADEITILLLSIKNYNLHFEHTSALHAPKLIPNYLPILDIDIEGLLSFQFQDTVFSQFQSLNHKKNELQTKLDKQKRLAVYNNIYWRPLQEVGTSRFLYNGIGVRFSSSLTSRNKERQKISDLKNQVVVQKHNEKFFNQQKELSNHLLEYHSKLRIYSRFLYKLRALQENKRLDHAVKLVNYQDPQSDLKALNIDLEKLSVEYELLEIKQQLYLLLLKIYKNSNVESILPFVRERNFEEIKKKLKGTRIAIIQSAYETQLEKEFLAEYLVKNELFSVIFKGNVSQNGVFIQHLADRGIKIYTGKEAFIHKEIIDVPINRFKSRVEMEYWIEDYQNRDPETIFLINDINQLIHVDSVVLEK